MSKAKRRRYSRYDSERTSQERHLEDRQKRLYQDPNVAYVPVLINENEEEVLETVEGRTENQKVFIQTIRKNDLTICTGCAGTGKTFLSVALALQALKDGTINKIILTRPIVEAGEKLGYLPGDLEEKINPYLRPLYDALNYMLGPGQYKNLMSQDIIEVAPLAYMRGRTLSNAFIIVDEAQNMTVDQIIMLLTRLGENSKMVINGDVTQIDLPKSKESGLVLLHSIVGHVSSIAFHHFTDVDVVRHPLVKEIVIAYEKWKSEKDAKSTHH
jgi:phosphate starvation-inducible protein PhoH and related proteins